jgi:predicted ABC-type ATPase
MIDRIDSLVAAGKSFAFETTCAGHRQAKLLRACRAIGYRVTLIFLWLPSPQAAIARVARRVARGGHHIPDDVVGRRYAAGIYNMRYEFLPLADVGLIYDNSGAAPLLIAEKRSGLPFVVRDAARWKLIEDAT